MPCEKRRKKVRQKKTKKDKEEKFVVRAFKKKERRVPRPMFDSSFH